MASHRKSLLVLTSPLNSLASHFKKYLPQTKEKTSTDTLYVHFLLQDQQQQQISLWSSLVKSMYAVANAKRPELDLRILCLKTSSVHNCQPFSHVYFGAHTSEDVVQAYLKSLDGSHQLVRLLEDDDTTETDSCQIEARITDQQLYDHVCLGGTFDRLHVGHKVLLTEGALRCSRKITVGVTNDSMVQNKTLCDLISPCQSRIRGVEEFLQELRGCSNGDDNNVVAITDPYGPAASDQSIQMIVASEETKRGCEAINRKRREEYGFKPLDVHLIGMVEDCQKHQSNKEEDKVSSSNRRMRMLGEQLKEPSRIFDDGGKKPYVIGLTGGSASGKTNIAKYLGQKHNVGVVDCDQLGHKAYEPGTQCYKRVLEAFGQDLKTQEGQIDRKKLSSRVFSDPSQLKRLESIVWPEILGMARQEMQRLSHEEGKDVVVLDAAVLLKAEWDQETHQVWAAFVDRPEAIRRIVERDGKTEAEAAKRLDSQMSNRELISKCHVVFCSKWEVDFTRSQVDKAMERLRKQYISSVKT